MRRRPAHALRLAGAAAGVAMVVTGVHLVLQPPVLHAADAGAVPAPAGLVTTPPRSAPAPATGVPATAVSAPAPLPPEQLAVASVGIDAPLVPIGVLPGGALDLPADPHQVGWWSAGAAPGAPAGTVVLAGHVDSASRGAGAMARLVDAPVGTAIDLDDARGGSYRYRLVARRTVAKDALPADAFRRSGAPQLVLLTCGGPFDAARGHYRDNVVVYAVPA